MLNDSGLVQASSTVSAHTHVTYTGIQAQNKTAEHTEILVLFRQGSKFITIRMSPNEAYRHNSHSKAGYVQAGLHSCHTFTRLLHRHSGTVRTLDKHTTSGLEWPVVTTFARDLHRPTGKTQGFNVPK